MICYKAGDEMKKDIIKILKYLMYFVIIILSVVLCMTFEIAQGERNEEIVFGVMLGIVLDFVYSIILLFINKKTNNK